MTVPQWIDTLDTPYLLIDEAILKRNIAHLKNRVESLGSHLRPHLKTSRQRPARPRPRKRKPQPVTA